jgi:hypothetical protein
MEKTGEIAMQVSQTGPPIRLMFRAKGEQETEEIAKELADLAGRLDFTEPLKRVGAALKEICGERTE